MKCNLQYIKILSIPIFRLNIFTCQNKCFRNITINAEINVLGYPLQHCLL